MLKKILFIVLLIQCGNIYANPPVIEFRHLKVKDGLSQSWVKSICQDRYGFMWFGTNEGLNKYDGYTFTVYKNNPEDKHSISNNTIVSIFEDKSGNLWVGTENGLNLYDREKDRFIYNTKLAGTRITDFLELEDGRIFMPSRNFGLYLYDPENDSIISYFRPKGSDPNIISSYSLTSILMDSSGNIWIGSGDGLNLLDTLTYKFTIFRNNEKDKNSLASNSIESLFLDSKNRLWLGTHAGLSLMKFNKDEPEKSTFINYKHNERDNSSINSGFVLALKEDKEGHLWIGINGGLDIIELNTFEEGNCIFYHYVNNPDDNTSLSYNSVYSLYEDRNGSIWVGSYGDGVNMYNKITKKFTHYNRKQNNPNSLSDNFVNALLDDNDYLWIGTDKGLNLFNKKNKTFKHFFHNPNKSKSLGSNSVCALEKDSKDNIWVGTWAGGLNLFNRKNNTFTRYMHDPNDNTSIGSNNMFGIIEDQDGDLWIGTMGGGLNLFDRKNKIFKRHRYNDPGSYNISDNWVRTVYESSYGEIWLSSSTTAELFDKKTEKFTHFSHDRNNPKSISYDGANMFFEDSKKNLWIGTVGGLNVFNREDSTFSHYNQADGLPNNQINGILEDDHGNLWISTNNGISKFINGINRPENPTFKNYDVGDGLQGDEFRPRSYCRDKRGRMYFGGKNGFNVFHPDSLPENSYIPPVMITRFLLFNKDVEIEAEDSPLKKHINLEEEVILSYKHTTIGFEYAALNFIVPEKNEYAIMLEGFDKEWNYVGNKREVTYTSLDPGTYIFRVKASNNDGLWNEEGTSLKITVTPPFWKTAWFRISMILLVISIAYVTHFVRVRSIVEYGRRLEIKVAGRTKELDYANKELEESANKLKTIVDAVSEGLAIVDKNHVILEANEFLFKLFGLKREAIINKKCSQVFNPWEETCENCPLEKLFKNRESSPVIEKTKVLKNGTIRYFNIQCYPIPNYSKESPKSVISIRDITERKNMEKKNIQNYNRKMKNLSHKLTLAEERERKRIATDLHAEIGQTLAFLKIKIGEVKAKNSAPNVQKSLEETYDLVQDAITSARSLMTQISPTILYELGFVPAVDWLAETILKENNIKYEFKDDGKEKPLTDDIRILLFQALRELLTNIRKHAKAKKVKISIKRTKGDIEITVKDNGIGFNISSLDSYCEKDVGFGLLNIRSRIDLVGGSFEIESHKKRGTKIILKAPLNI